MRLSLQFMSVIHSTTPDLLRAHFFSSGASSCGARASLRVPTRLRSLETFARRIEKLGYKSDLTLRAETRKIVECA